MTKRQKNLLEFAREMRASGVRRVEFDGVTIELDPEPGQRPGELPAHIIDAINKQDELTEDQKRQERDRLWYYSA